MVNVVIFTDNTSVMPARAAGAYRIATEMRKHGYTVQVINHFLLAGLDIALKLIDKFVGLETLMIGFSSTFMNEVPNYVDENDEVRFKYIGGIPNPPRPGEAKRKWFPVTRSIGVPISLGDLLKMRARAQKLSPNIKFVLGGSACETTAQSGIDTFVMGYADTVIIEYLKYLEGKNPFFQYTPVPDGKIVTGKIMLDKDEQASSFDFQNSTIEYEPSDFIRRGEPLQIEVSRGCIFRCKFCSFRLNGKNKLDHIKDSEVLYAELMRNYEKYGTTNYAFSDDTYNDSVYKVEALGKVFSRLPFKIVFSAYLRHDMLQRFPEMADILKESGLRGAVFGIETLNHVAGKIIGKGLAPEKTKEMLHWLRDDKGWKNNILMYSGFMIGLPGDTRETVMSWAYEALNHKYPLDSMTFMACGVSANPKKRNRSMIELDYEKYGYTFPTDDHNNWVNKDWTYLDCIELANTFNDTALITERNKVGGFSPVILEQYGITWDQIRSIPIAELNRVYGLRNRIKNRTKRWANEYHQSLLAL